VTFQAMTYRKPNTTMYRRRKLKSNNWTVLGGNIINKPNVTRQIDMESINQSIDPRPSLRS